MADKKKMSVDEILAACRQAGGEGGGSTMPAKPEVPSESAEPQKEQPPASPSKGASPKPGGMSVDEILAAAAEKEDGTKADKPLPGPKPAAKKPATSASSGGKPGDKRQEMSLDEILAAAREGKETPAAKPKPSESSQPKAAKKPPQKAASKTAGPKDTASILSTGRKGVKPGPMSKAEAAARGATVQPQARPKRVEPKTKTKRTAPPLPKKPAYAQPKAKAASAQDRRGFIGVLFGSFLAVGFTMMSAVFGLWSFGLARFMFPNILTEPPNRFTVGFPSDFAAGMVETKYKALFGIWVVNTIYDGQPQIFALKTVCTHLGCTPNWLDTEQKFKCPCHGSGFYKDGVNFEGPAPRPLERYAIRLADDGQLEVDKSRTFQEELGQWRTPPAL